ncbi:hypothetical protein ACHQM5_025727 [Ranunculus cassubicifolius]
MSKSSAMAVITPEDVLETLMNDGTIDTIRSKIINHLKANEELKNSTISMVEQSKVLHTPGSEKQTKRELFDALRQELESPALERASKSVWDLILDNDGFGKEINQTVERAFCLLSGCHPPLFPIQHDPSPSLPPAPGNLIFSTYFSLSWLLGHKQTVISFRLGNLRQGHKHFLSFSSSLDDDENSQIYKTNSNVQINDKWIEEQPLERCKLEAIWVKKTSGFLVRKIGFGYR